MCVNDCKLDKYWYMYFTQTIRSEYRQFDYEILHMYSGVETASDAGHCLINLVNVW